MGKPSTKVHFERPRTRAEDLIESVCGDIVPRRSTSDMQAFRSLPGSEQCCRCIGVLARPERPKERPKAAHSDRPKNFTATRESVAQELRDAWDTLPPRFTPEAWRTSCQGAPRGRCRNCWLCEWEANQIDRYAHIDKSSRQPRRPGDPMFRSFKAALYAVYVWRADGARAASATGPMLDKARDGLIGFGAYTGPGEDGNADLAWAVAKVEVALEALSVGAGFGKLSGTACRSLLMRRVMELGSWEEMAAEHGVSIQEIRTAHNKARGAVSLRLLEAGLIPKPRTRGPTQSAAWQRDSRELITVWCAEQGPQEAAPGP